MKIINKKVSIPSLVERSFHKFYQLLLILTALLPVDLLNMSISLGVFLSGQHDVALFE